jgi:hypothetical protein
MIFITDDDVVLETVPKEGCEGCYFNKGCIDCDSPLPACIRFTTSFIWKPISNKTKKKLMSLLTNKEIK